MKVKLRLWHAIVLTFALSALLLLLLELLEGSRKGGIKMPARRAVGTTNRFHNHTSGNQKIDLHYF